MRTKFAIHPAEYAIGENEKFYSDMAQRGWRLVSRGAYLSRFQRAEPERARYRIEVAAAGAMDDYELPEEKMALFEDCGWEYVTARGYIHIFRAPEGSEAPEFYMEPAEQAATLRRLRRSYLLSPVVVVLILGFWFLMISAMSTRDTPPAILRGIGLQTYKLLVEQTALILFTLVILAQSIYEMFYGMARMAGLYRRLKRGQPLDHAPKKRRLVHRVVTGTLMALAAVCLLLAVVELAGCRKVDLPAAADGPYLTLDQLGWEGERGTIFYKSKTSSREHSRSLAAEMWRTYECVHTRDGQDVQLYQDVYDLRFPSMADPLLRALCEDSTFARSFSEFRQRQVPGWDRVYIAHFEAVAVRGSRVVRFCLLPSEQDPEAALLEVLAAYGQKNFPA